jgi:hypothetical protein
MSNQNEQTILVEKHFIPIGIYQQIYGNQQPASLSSQSFINIPETNNIPSPRLFGTTQVRPDNQSANAANIRTTRRTTFSTLNPENNHTTQHNYNINEYDTPPQNSRNADNVRTERTGIRIETIDSVNDDNEANLFNALFSALINPSRLNTANSNQDRPTGLTANQIENNSTVISYNNQTEDNLGVDNQPSSSICSVCTLEYETGQQVRCLDVCRHAFHTGCIDRWLADHSTCPLCRSSVIPRPTDTNNTNPNGTTANRSSYNQPSTSRIRTTTRINLNGLD